MENDNSSKPSVSEGRAGGLSKAAGMRREVVRKYRQVGLFGTVKHIVDKVTRDVFLLFFPSGKMPDPFDQKYGTDTAGIIGVGSLDIAEDEMEHSMHYGAIWEDEFTRAMETFPIRCEDLVFVDIGSGKGRALLLASLYPFRKIIGVELSAMLHETALANIRIFKDERQKCHNIEVLCANGADFEIPREPLLIFLCNPFDDQVMEVVVSHIEKSFREYPRELYIWYVKACYREVLDRAKFLEIINDTGRYVLYRARTGEGYA